MSGYQSYRKQQVEGAGPLGLVLLVYEALIQSLVQTRSAIEAEDFEIQFEQITRAMRALLELISSLDHEQGGQIASNLASMYAYMYRRLLEGQSGDMVGAINEVLPLAQTLREGWQELADVEEKQAVESRSMSMAAVA